MFTFKQVSRYMDKTGLSQHYDSYDVWNHMDSWRRLGPNQMGKPCGRGWVGLRGACQRAKHHGGDKAATLKASKLALADKIRGKRGLKSRESVNEGRKGDRSRPQKITKDMVDKTPWEFTASQYQGAHGVHQPWIAEASPMQSGLMGKRERSEYKDRRSKEWGDSEKIKQEWEDKVWDAFKSGKVTREELSTDRNGRFGSSARDLVERREESTKKADMVSTMAKAKADNEIKSVDEVELGDRVHDYISGRTIGVSRKFKSSVKGLDDNGVELKISLGRMMWRDRDELQGVVDRGENIRPSKRK